MGVHIDPETFDLQRFAESLVREGREAVKWERRKLEWIREEKAKQAEKKTEAA